MDGHLPNLLAIIRFVVVLSSAAEVCWGNPTFYELKKY